MALLTLTKINAKIPCCYGCVAYSSKIFKEMEYKKCYEVLGVSESSDHEEIRRAYLMLVKRYHPDSNEGDINRFHEVDRAFRTLTAKKSRERWGVDDDPGDVQEQNINHTAPQHRQYLSYGGVGSGTPYQRQKQYAKVRAMQAADSVLQHRISKVAAEENALMQKAPLKHKIKTKYGFERLVEDLIQEAMSKGQFNNLSGCGKPLQNDHNKNPYVDFVTHKMNEILIENGFTPEWIMLQKEIRQETQILKNGLTMERQYIGPQPLTPEDAVDWGKAVDKYAKLVTNVNKKINKFNLVVPVLNKQMLLIDLKKEAQKVLANGRCSSDCGLRKVEKVSEKSSADTTNIFGFLDTLFRK